VTVPVRPSCTGVAFSHSHQKSPRFYSLGRVGYRYPYLIKLSLRYVPEAASQEAIPCGSRHLFSMTSLADHGTICRSPFPFLSLFSSFLDFPLGIFVFNFFLRTVPVVHFRHITTSGSPCILGGLLRPPFLCSLFSNCEHLGFYFQNWLVSPRLFCCLYGSRMSQSFFRVYNPWIWPNALTAPSPSLVVGVLAFLTCSIDSRTCPHR